MSDPVKARPRRERVLSLLQPAASACVRLTTRWRVDPLWLVTLHGVMGLTAAYLIATSGPGVNGMPSSPGWIVAALLLLGKAILDNADGGLARATGKVTRMGRYYDTGVDLISGVALFAALATLVPAALALAGWFASTIVLSLDFNMERLYRAVHDPREERGPAGSVDIDLPRGAPAPLYALFEGLYRLLFAPQDRWIEVADRALFRRIDGVPYRHAPAERQRRWSDLFSTAALVDLGLSTQNVALAALLIVGVPGAFPWLALAGLAWATAVQLRRVTRYRAYSRLEEADSE